MWLKACTNPVPATAVPNAANADFFKNSRRSIGVQNYSPVIFSWSSG